MTHRPAPPAPARPYAAHERLVAPARARPELWRLLAGIVVVGVLAFVLTLMLYSVVATISPSLAIRLNPPPGIGVGTTPGALLVMLYSFGTILVATSVAAALLQRRDPLGLIGPPGLALRQFWLVLRALLLLLVALMFLPPYNTGAPLVPNLPLSRWLALLPFSLGAVLVQTASEEIFFRGYLQQSLAARFSSPVIWMGVPALLFGLGHYSPADAGANAGILVLWAVIFGLFTADLTARAGTLGPAIALHLANNVTALLLVSTPDSLSGLSLATTPFSISDTDQMRAWMGVDFALMIVSWLAARLALRR